MEKEALILLIEEAIRICKTDLKMNGKIGFAATLYVRDNNQLLRLVIPFGNESQKDKERNYSMIMLIARVLNAEAVIYEVLAWASASSNGMPASKADDRRECLLITAAMKGFKRQVIVYFHRANGEIVFDERDQSDKLKSIMTDPIWEGQTGIEGKPGDIPESLIERTRQMACDLLPQWKGPVAFMIDEGGTITSMRLCKKPSEGKMDRFQEFKAKVLTSNIYTIFYVQKDKFLVPVIRDGKFQSTTRSQPVVVLSICTSDQSITVVTPYSEVAGEFVFLDPIITAGVDEKLDPASWMRNTYNA